MDAILRPNLVLQHISRQSPKTLSAQKCRGSQIHSPHKFSRTFTTTSKGPCKKLLLFGTKPLTCELTHPPHRCRTRKMNLPKKLYPALNMVYILSFTFFSLRWKIIHFHFSLERRVFLSQKASTQTEVQRSGVYCPHSPLTCSNKYGW